MNKLKDLKKAFEEWVNWNAFVYNKKTFHEKVKPRPTDYLKLILSKIYYFKRDKTVAKRATHHVYRMDLGLWETKVWIGYTYGIFETNHWRLFRKNPKKAEVFKGPIPLPEIYIDRKEFEEEYKGNKYIVPENRIYDSKLP